MKYLYYPGCSLKSSGKPYEESLLAVFAKLGLELPEVKDWNCCGATAYMAVDETKAFALAARNLCMAEQQDGQEGVQFVTPCNACYLVHMKAQNYMQSYTQVGTVVQKALGAAGLHYDGMARVRHPLDVLVNDIGLAKLKEKITQPLKGWKIACYYGCQIVRPYATFDNQYNPMTMDQVLRAAGAETIDWPLKTRCCGGTLTGTVEEAGQRLSQVILREARKRGAHAVATACPLCQFNLECYQGAIAGRFGESVDIPVAYFTQFLGRAMGIADEQLGLQRLMVPLQQPQAAAV